MCSKRYKIFLRDCCWSRYCQKKKHQIVKKLQTAFVLATQPSFYPWLLNQYKTRVGSWRRNQTNKHTNRGYCTWLLFLVLDLYTTTTQLLVSHPQFIHKCLYSAQYICRNFYLFLFWSFAARLHERSHHTHNASTSVCTAKGKLEGKFSSIIISHGWRVTKELRKRITHETQIPGRISYNKGTFREFSIPKSGWDTQLLNLALFSKIPPAITKNWTSEYNVREWAHALWLKTVW
jgi:hypothetical protein